MLNVPNLLIIGGTGRNVGKTTLALILIEKYSNFDLLGLKISVHRTGEEQFHGKHEYSPNNGFIINKETLIQPWKDTARMASSGAKMAFYIQTSESQTLNAYNEFSSLYNTGGSPVICESKSLPSYLKPGLFIFIQGAGQLLTEPIQSQADIIFNYNEGIQRLYNLAERIKLTPSGWSLSS